MADDMPANTPPATISDTDADVPRTDLPAEAVAEAAAALAPMGESHAVEEG